MDHDGVPVSVPCVWQRHVCLSPALSSRLGWVGVWVEGLSNATSFLERLKREVSEEVRVKRALEVWLLGMGHDKADQREPLLLDLAKVTTHTETHMTHTYIYIFVDIYV